MEMVVAGLKVTLARCVHRYSGIGDFPEIDASLPSLHHFCYILIIEQASSEPFDTD